LDDASSGDVVFIPGTANIDLDGTSGYGIKGGVTLASDRGQNGSSGGLITKKVGAGGGWCEPTLRVEGDGARVTGLRMEGEMFPSTDEPVVPESQYLVGLASRDNTGFEVDNCELRGFAWASVQVDNQDTPGVSAAHVHHNYIHYSLARGEGYGVEIYAGHVLIEANIFDNNRHSIACGGLPGEEYEARYNHHLGHGTGIGFAHFDIHDSQGDTYRMHHNTFDLTDVWCIGLQSSGHKSTYIDHNVFTTSFGCDEPIFQHGTENLYVSNNYCNGDLYTDDSIVGYY
jgi:hypothetical protein